MKKLLLLSGLGIILTAPLMGAAAAAEKSALIITHGALGADTQEWYQPGGDFYEVILEGAHDLGFELVEPFTWKEPYNGITYGELLEGAQNLATRIIELHEDGFTKIVLIGHSYGGHVIKLASHLLDETATTLPIKTIARTGGTLAPTASDYTTYQRIHFRLNTYGAPVIQKPIISIVYTLGSPNVTSDFYAPNMKTIGKFYNVYSNGDGMQDLVGDKTINEIAGVINLRVQFLAPEFIEPINPNHTGMHSPSIGKYLLQIPEIFTHLGTGDKFREDQFGLVTFFTDDRTPIYSYDPERPFERCCCVFKPCVLL